METTKDTLNYKRGCCIYMRRKITKLNQCDGYGIYPQGHRRCDCHIIVEQGHNLYREYYLCNSCTTELVSDIIESGLKFKIHDVTHQDTCKEVVVFT